MIRACRSEKRGETATEKIRNESLQASLEPIQFDLASLASIRRFADAFTDRHLSLHLLCNKAGVMAIPYRKTADGFEMQFYTNHLGLSYHRYTMPVR